MFDENLHYFCKINFIKNYEELEISSKLLKNTITKSYGLLQTYIRKNCPYIIQDIYIGKLKGIEVFLPLTRDDAINDYEFYNEIMQSAINDILSCDINIMKFYNVLKPLDIDISRLSLLSIMPMVNFALDNIGKKKGYINCCVLLSEDNFKNMYVLGHMMDFCKEISVFAKEISTELKCFIDNIYEEFGIYISIVDNEKVFVDYLKSSDITINLSEEERNFVHKFKSNSSFIDIGNGSSNFKEVIGLREDVLTIWGANFKVNNEKVTKEECYFILEILDNKFINFLRKKDLSISLDDFKYVKVANFDSNGNTFKGSNK